MALMDRLPSEGTQHAYRHRSGIRRSLVRMRRVGRVRMMTTRRRGSVGRGRTAIATAAAAHGRRRCKQSMRSLGKHQHFLKSQKVTMKMINERKIIQDKLQKAELFSNTKKNTISMAKRIKKKKILERLSVLCCTSAQ
jgi:hypothetical protein